MRKMVCLLVMIFIKISFNPLSAQSNCKVLLPSIGDAYQGECKQGLADGYGEAFGIDQYKGNFKKGLPDGKGVYIWQTGDKYEGSWKKGLRDGEGIYTMKSPGRDSVLAGIWKNDVYVGKKELPDYVIQYRNNIGRVTCMKTGNAHNYIRFKFSRAGESSTVQVSNLMTTGSSGTESLTNDFVGYENVEFPFEGKIRFRAPSALQTTMLDCELRYVINNPGEWLLTIYY